MENFLSICITIIFIICGFIIGIKIIQWLCEVPDYIKGINQSLKEISKYLKDNNC